MLAIFHAEQYTQLDISENDISEKGQESVHTEWWQIEASAVFENIVSFAGFVRLAQYSVWTPEINRKKLLQNFTLSWLRTLPQVQ